LEDEFSLLFFLQHSVNLTLHLHKFFFLDIFSYFRYFFHLFSFSNGQKGSIRGKQNVENRRKGQGTEIGAFYHLQHFTISPGKVPPGKSTRKGDGEWHLKIKIFIKLCEKESK